MRSGETDAGDRLRLGPIGDHAVHLCIDMQELFARPTPWHVPSMTDALANVERIAGARPAQTIFTRFVPARTAEAATGAWRGYYRHWHAVTLEELEPGLLELLPTLSRLAPPAEVIDKSTYGPWSDPALRSRLEARAIDTLVITGGETDVCVLGAVLGAVDFGYRTIVVSDALCSSSETAHDAVMDIYRRRYAQQIETVRTEALLGAWASSTL